MPLCALTLLNSLKHYVDERYLPKRLWIVWSESTVVQITIIWIVDKFSHIFILIERVYRKGRENSFLLNKIVSIFECSVRWVDQASTNLFIVCVQKKSQYFFAP